VSQYICNLKNKKQFTFFMPSSRDNFWMT